MSDIKKSVFSSIVVVACCASLIGGMAWRNRIDVGQARLAPALPVSEGWIASTTPPGDYPEEVYYENLVSLLQQKYVDPVGDESKLALGAVKGMVSSLGDVGSQYMDPEQFRIYQGELQGNYEGIGALLVLDVETGKSARLTPTDESGQPNIAQNPSAIPVAKVATIVPGGPADKAGIHVGDWVEAINGRWVLSPTLVAEFQKAREAIQKPGMSPATIFQLTDRLQEKTDKMILPTRVIDKLSRGTSGFVSVTFNHAGSSLQRKIAKAASYLPPVEAGSDGSIKLRFQPGAAQILEKQIAGRTSVTLDLRAGGRADLQEVKRVLALLGPPGSYGTVWKPATKSSTTFAVSDGSSQKRQITVLVDRGTVGPAEIFALALGSRKIASVKGSTGGNREIVETVPLPGGAAFTLTTGEYRPGGSR